MHVFMQPCHGPFLPEPEEIDFLPPADREAWEKKARDAQEKAEQEKYDAVERRRQIAADNVRREREEASIEGKLSDEAQVYLDLKLKPRMLESPQYRAKVKTPVVQGLLNKNTLCWAVGSSGTFKSFVTADLAFRYGSEDMDYYGRKMTHGRALIVVAEGEDAYAFRKEAWEKQYDREVKNVTFHPGALQLADVVKEMPALIHFLKAAEEEGAGYGMIIFDTQAMCTVGVDENKSEMNLVINILHQIRQATDACVLTVHHFGKDERKGMRGSSMLYAAADTVMVLKRESDSLDVLLSTAQGDEGKQKDNPTEKDFLKLHMESHVVGMDYFGDPVTSLAAILADDIREVAGDAPTVTVPDLTERQLFYLQELSAYGEDGTSPGDFAKDMEAEGQTEPRGGVVTRQAARKVWVRELKAKGLAENVPKADARFRATSLGGSAIMRALSNGTPQRWVDRAQNPRVRARVREPYGSELPNPSEP